MFLFRLYRYSRGFLCLLFLFMALDASGLHSQEAEPALEQYLIKTWTVQTGMPQNTVMAIVQTNEGYIWIGTSYGLVRFDGVRFKIFTRQNSPLLTEKITCLFEDAGRTLWIGTEGGGLYSYDSESWTNMTQEDGLSHNHIRSITGD